MCSLSVTNVFPDNDYFCNGDSNGRKGRSDTFVNPRFNTISSLYVLFIYHYILLIYVYFMK